TSTFVVMSNTLESDRVRDTTTARPNSTCMSLASARKALENASHPAIAQAGSSEAVQAATSAKIVDRIRIQTPPPARRILSLLPNRLERLTPSGPQISPHFA